MLNQITFRFCALFVVIIIDSGNLEHQQQYKSPIFYCWLDSIEAEDNYVSAQIKKPGYFEKTVA